MSTIRGLCAVQKQILLSPSPRNMQPTQVWGFRIERAYGHDMQTK